MQKISVAYLKPGMVVGRNIYNLEGSLLLAAGIELNFQYIEKLKKQQIGSVYVTNHLLGDVEIPEVIREETRVQAVQAVQKSYKEFSVKRKLNIIELRSTADQILDEIIGNRGVMIQLTDIRTYDSYTFSHSVQVCVLSVLIAISMGYPEQRLRELAIGALVHDIGKTAIPLDILNKPARLSDGEMDIVREHTKIGFDLLRNQGYLSAKSIYIALSHHERFDGSGYPRGISGKEIHEYARVVAIADVFDAITADRPYQKAKLPDEAYEILMSGSGTQFDTDILRIFFKHISIYPIGSMVELNTGEWALVTHVYSGIPFRPCVKILADKDGNRPSQSREVDLTEQLTLTIVRVLREEEYVARFKDMYGLKS